MAVCKTIQIGEPVLRETAQNVADFSARLLQQAIKDLTDTMQAEDLIGMAAPQLGKSIQVFVTEIRKTEIRKGISDELRVYINPEIIDVSHETELDWEGCGSIPWIFGQVKRTREITLKYRDERGVSREMSASGLLVRVIQHEIDHLNGVLFTDVAEPKTYVSRAYYLEHIK